MKTVKKSFMLAGVFLLLLLAGVGTGVKTVKADTTTRTINVYGKTYYMVSNEYRTSLYLKNGYYYTLVAQTSQSFMNYSFSYKRNLYFVGGGEGRPCVTYKYKVGSYGFQRVGSVYLSGHKGKYAVGYTTLAGDPSPSSLCMYNLSTGRLTSLGRGCDIKFIGNKIYYAACKNKYTMQIVRRNSNGSGKKVIKTIRTAKKNRLTYVGKITSHSATCYIITPNWVVKTVRF